MPERTDKRIAYGARCTWWDSVYEAAVSSRTRLPCCPHCGGVLFEVETEEKWWKQVNAYENDGHPGYRAMIEWSRGKCYSTPARMYAAYQLYRSLQ